MTDLPAPPEEQGPPKEQGSPEEQGPRQERPVPQTTPPVLVDARGLRCPLPVIRLAQVARDCPAGTVIEVWATDPAARADIPAWCRMRAQDYLGEVPTDGDHAAYRVRTA